MSGAELGLAVFATIDLCFKYGSNLAQLCTSMKGAETEIAERVLGIESCWKRTSLQLDFLRRIWHNLDREHRSIQDQILQVLISKLNIAISKIEGLGVGDGSLLHNRDHQRQIPGVRKWKYALLKEGLDRTIEDLERWQKMFDPSWFLIIMASSPQIDAELTQNSQSSSSSSSSTLISSTQTLRNSVRGTTNSSVFRSEDGLRSAQVYEIPFSVVKVAQRAGSRKLLILDHVPYQDQGSITQLTTNVRDLARRLLHTDPIQFGLLQCSCVIREPAAFTFVFKMAEGFSMPRSLRGGLLAGEVEHSLSERLDLARQLAKSINYVHTLGFVHKGVRPETVLVATNKSSSLGTPFLVGFDQFRAAEGSTGRFGDSMWEKNLYRHPRRQGLNPDDYYIMQHDIYSLGVCLLEIGLWESFIYYNDDGTCIPSPIFSVIPASPYTNAEVVSEFLVTYARTILPRRMGSKYASVVETCLTCLDEGNADFGDESQFQDADGVLVGVRYIEKVLLKLDDISM